LCANEDHNIVELNHKNKIIEIKNTIVVRWYKHNVPKGAINT